jgi:hypothetical protein
MQHILSRPRARTLPWTLGALLAAACGSSAQTTAPVSSGGSAAAGTGVASAVGAATSGTSGAGSAQSATGAAGSGMSLAAGGVAPGSVTAASTAAGSGGSPAPAGSAGTPGAAGSSAAAAGASGSGSAGAAAPAGSGPASFSRVWTEVLFPKGCAGAYCHGAGQGSLKFTTKEDAYKALVGVKAAGMACGTSGKERVKAGDPAASLLIEKLEQTKPSCGDPMPIGTKVEPNCVSMSQPVCNTQAELSLIKQWIAAGAKDD